MFPMQRGKPAAGRIEPGSYPSESTAKSPEPDPETLSTSNLATISALHGLLPTYKTSPSLYWKSVRLSKRVLSQSQVSEITGIVDPRPHATVQIGEHYVKGLLDSGASVSCLGFNGIEFAQNLNVKVKSVDSSIKTADGSDQKVHGFVDVPVTYNSKTILVRLYIVPSLSQQLYLGIDFWIAFGLLPKLVNEIENSKPSGIDDNKHPLSPEQSQLLLEAIDLLPSCEKEGLGKTSFLSHTINTGDVQPIKQRHYPVSPAVQAEMYAELDRMLSLGVIEPSQSPWNSPIVMVRKHCGKARLCLDSRAVNNVSVKDAYPLPIIDGILSRLGDTFFISSIDLKDAFWQIELDQTSREKTAFTVPGRSLYQFVRMPFGLCNAAQTMCRLMDKVIGPELRESVFVYIDDLLIVSADFESHINRIREVAKRLRTANLTINVTKSKFAMREIKYLGYIVGNGCLKTDPEKIRAISEFPQPATIRQLRRFLGLTGWYQRFISNYSAVSAPLSDIKGKPEKFKWSAKAQEAFEALKHCLTSAPVLTHPDFSKPFLVQCDASLTGVGSVLCQVGEDGQEHPIAFMSKKLNAAQRNYSVTELECYAAVLSVKKFRPYIEGMKFTIVTDHASLKWLMSQKDLGGRLARWSLKLQAFDFSIEHRKGSAHVVPDTLSRVYMEELSVPNELNISIDLDSPLFLSDEYLERKNLIVTDKERLPNLEVQDAHIFIRTEKPENGSQWKLWVPTGLTDQLIKNAHNPPLAAHCGFAKTIEKIRRLFFWPEMTKQVRKFVQSCETCKETKAPNIILRPPMGKQTIVDQPWQRLYIDLLGPYPRSKYGNTFAIIVLDQFSKFVLLKAIRNATALEIVRYVEKEVFHLFGVPESITSDNGGQFRSNEFENLLTRYGVSHIPTGNHSPQANASERVNRSILASVRSYIGDDHRNWDAELTSIASALRNNVHSSTGFSPHYLVFNRHIVHHGSSYNLLRKLGTLRDPSIEILAPIEHRNLQHERVRENLRKAHEAHERTYNRSVRTVNFKPGQEVFRRNFVQSNFEKNINAKLAKKFLKCRVTRKVGTALYELEDLKGKPIPLRYHAKDLRQ